MFEYKYHPIYKYIAVIVLFLLFMVHYDCISKEKYIPMALIFGVFVILLDYMVIHNHPPLMDNNIEPVNNKNIIHNKPERNPEKDDIPISNNNDELDASDIEELNKQLYQNQIKLEKLKNGSA